ncbi:MAG: aldehyde ferredoxin oxidoreductase family protein [Candidatus Bathyarchaeia archaeon]
MHGGYAGRILRVNLSKSKIDVVPLSNDLIEGYIGGTGFCTKLLYDETGPETNPLGPENRVIVAIGPLTGTSWPSSGRVNIASKSPLTGIFGESNSGGHFGPVLKFAGYDAIVVYGRSEKPVYLWIEDDRVELMDAKHLWGKTTWETDKTIKKDLGDERIQVACIGPAGEGLVRFANVITEGNRAMARTGIGAVMGSKRLKAIAVQGSKDVKRANQAKFDKLLDYILEEIRHDEFSKVFSKYGTPVLVDMMNAIGRFPTKNFQTGVFPMAHKINAESLLKYKIGKRGCYACRFSCKNVLMLESEPYAGLSGDQPEYETIDALGARCWNDDIESIIYGGWLCNQYGIDTISAGNAIAFAMELWEKGIITREDTGGLDLTWGNKDTIIEMIHKIAKREGFGALFSDGIFMASKRIGKGSESYAMHVKGLDIPAQDGRAQRSMAIAHATSPRGADHLRHCCFLDEIGLPEPIEKRFGNKYLPEMADRLSPKYKGIMAKELEDFTALVDSLLVCVYALLLHMWEDLTEVYTAVTGIEVKPAEMKLKCERIVNLKRAYNIKHGLSRKEDALPERFLKERAPDGPCKGHVVELDLMLDEYYESRGWDKKTGLIPKSKLTELGLDAVAKEFERKGLLP